MRIRILSAAALVVVLSWLAGTATIGAQSTGALSNEAIAAVLKNRIDVEKRGVAIVVGVIEPSGRRTVAHGTFSAVDKRPADATTVFEIGSVTKVFTSMLLADMANRGEVSLEDPVGKYLPSGAKMPERDQRVITLQDLATHTSALPRLPTNFVVTNALNPYADYTVERLYEFLSGHTLRREVGSLYEYSNLGVGLLGYALSSKAGTDYDTLVKTRIASPLRMSDTSVRLDGGQKTRLAQGHNPRLEAVPNWDLPAFFAGAGAIRSTANDMLQFLDATLGPPDSTVGRAMSRMLSVRKPTGAPNLQIGLGWHVTTREGVELLWHNGATGGYSAFIGIVPAQRLGVVVLANATAATTGSSVDDIGLHVLNPQFPLTKPIPTRTRVTVDPAILQRYAGRYQLAPGFVATVIYEEGRLFVQPQGQPRHEIFAEGERSFFATIADAQFTFEVDASGRATTMTLYQAGKRIPGKRIE